MREKNNNIMNEELFNGIESNSQIYVSDHLTPYFAKIFYSARMAKKDGKIFQVSSRGGKIRVKKNERDGYEYIFSLYELDEIINNESIGNTSTSLTTNTQNQNTHKQNNNNKSNAALKNNKRKAEENTSRTDTNKKPKNISLRENNTRQNKTNVK